MKVYQLYLFAHHCSTPTAVVQEIYPRMFKSRDAALQEAVRWNDIVKSRFVPHARGTSGTYLGFDCHAAPIWIAVEIDTDLAI